MKKIITRPHLFFLSVIPIVFIFGLLNKGQTMDIEYFGGVLPINIWSVSLFSSVFFLLISFNYLTLFWTDKNPKKVLSILHIVFQILSFGFFYYYKTMHHGVQNEQINQINDVLIISILLFVLATMIHLINFFTALIRKSK